MKRVGIFFILIFLSSCIIDEDPIEKRKTLAEINDLRAFLDVEQVGKNFESGYVFKLKPIDNSVPYHVFHVGDDGLICRFLNEQLKYGSSQTENCAGLVYYYGYLNNGIKSGNYRMQVNISGLIKKKIVSDHFTGEPFLLESITKVPSCPISFEIREGELSLENKFWQLQAFLDENGDILSYPTFEDTAIGIYFYDSLNLFGASGTELKSLEIITEVWIRQNFIPVYSTENGKIIISPLAIQIRPLPSTYPTDNISTVTLDIYNKYDSLNLLLKVNQSTEYSLNQNVLELYNPETKVKARFFNPFP